MAQKEVASSKPLCKVTSGGFKLREVRPFVQDARFICRKCGRAAASSKSLCNPAKLQKG